MTMVRALGCAVPNILNDSMMVVRGRRMMSVPLCAAPVRQFGSQNASDVRVTTAWQNTSRASSLNSMSGSGHRTHSSSSGKSLSAKWIMLTSALAGTIAGLHTNEAKAEAKTTPLVFQNAFNAAKMNEAHQICFRTNILMSIEKNIKMLEKSEKEEFAIFVASDILKELASYMEMNPLQITKLEIAIRKEIKSRLDGKKIHQFDDPAIFVEMIDNIYILTNKFMLSEPIKFQENVWRLIEVKLIQNLNV